uniref:Uncharacterized protein n=1 Tax=Rhizophora mucronata TaxID=61149 RepID=A0A2P2NRH0_RHIMU
MYVINKHA